MAHTSHPSCKRQAQGGFTLIELMVGVVLGMLTVLVITQVTVQAEGRKRTTSMGSDAQVNGSLSLYTLQRDIQMAGYGAVTAPDALGCTVTGQHGAGGTALSVSFTLAPVVISNGTNGAPDTITVIQARTQGFSVPTPITANATKTSEYFTVDTSLGVSNGDMMVAVPAGPAPATQCALFQVESNTASADTTLSISSIPHVTSDDAQWNQSSVFPDAGYKRNSYLVNMGNMAHMTYSVDASNNLALEMISSATGTKSSFELYPQIVNLQAMYGKDTTGDGVVDTYDNTTPTSATDWQRVLTIRVAVVARSHQYEKDAVTTAEPLWDVGTTTTISGTSACNGSSQCLTLKVDRLPDWQHYRYKVFETIVPLRNVLWNS